MPETIAGYLPVPTFYSSFIINPILETKKQAGAGYVAGTHLGKDRIAS